MIARVGLIGDVHGRAEELEIALDFLREQSPDAILCTGDLPIKDGKRSVETAATLNRCAQLLRLGNVHTVCGNHDRYLVENADDSLLAELFPEEWTASREALAFIRALPVTREFATPRGNLLLCHGVGKKDTASVFPGGDSASVAETLAAQGITSETVSVLVMGHTHQRMHRIVGGITLINPGTLLAEKEAPGFAFADFAAGVVQFYKIRSGRIAVDAAYQWE